MSAALGGAAAGSTVAAIVAMTDARVIGRSGTGIPWHYSEDLKRFRRMTLHTSIIMGRHTFESLDAKPLPKRRNIVVSSRLAGRAPHSAGDTALHFCADIETALDIARQGAGNMIWIIGGGQLYRDTLTLCDLVDVTYVPDKISGEGLIYFPEIDDNEWQGSALQCPNSDSRLRLRQFTRRPTSLGR